MKRSIRFIVFAILCAHILMDANSQPPTSNYDSAWKKVEGFVKKNLPSSALAEVKKIYATAKKENQDAQLIKALVHINSLQYETREENEALSIAELEQEIPGKSGINRALLNGLLANQYWNYYQNNRWRFYDRTQTINVKKNEITTWTVDDFHHRISELYLLSLEQKSLLQQTPLKGYDAIIEKGNMPNLRPTLYDLLAFQALGYFQNDERDLNKPAYLFEIADASAFDPAPEFIHRKFETQDSSSLYYRALLILQDLISFHLHDTTPDALIDADLIRYNFVRAKSTNPEKEKLYLKGIEQIAQQYKNIPAAAQAWYLVAANHYALGDSYTAHGDTTYRYEKVKAKEIAERVAAEPDSSEGKANAIYLLQRLIQPALRIRTEQVNLPGKPFRALIGYTNIQAVHFRIIRSTPQLKEEAGRPYQESYWRALIAANPLRSWTQELPDTKDLQSHRIEAKIDPLPSGEYFLFASSGESFTIGSSVLVAKLFYVSAISFVNSKQDFFVLNRENGQPLRNARVQVWEGSYENSTSKLVRSKGPVYSTDQNGFFRLAYKPITRRAGRRYSYNYSLEITTKDDRLYIDQDQTFYPHEYNQPRPQTQIYFFRDRAIYRPGQTVFFKGIVLLKNGPDKQTDIMPEYQTTVYLKNTNGETVDSISLQTNEYGSFAGKFQLPSAGLNGSFSFIAGRGSSYNNSFLVEEYKRPKFFVEYESLKGSYRVNDSIEVTGFAKAYARNNIDGAKVKYRVVRETRFLYTWLFKRWWEPQSAPLEIAHGETTTDAEGKFAVKFSAIPDLKMDQKFDPTFDYVIYADVTDINGETRSGQKNVSVSYKSLLLKVEIPGKMPVDSLHKISIRTENNNGEFEPAQVTVRIFRLKAENRLIRKRLWQQPDLFLFTKEEYLKYFPYDNYKDETDPASWEKEGLVLERTDFSKKDIAFELNATIAEEGVYCIEIFTKDKDGKDIKDVRYVTLFNEKNNQPEQATYFTATNPSAIEPGETATVELASTADNLFIIQEINKKITADSSSSVYSFVELNNEKKKLSFEATEADRGGYGLSWVFVKHNQLFINNKTIDIPWSNKMLAIEYTTHRDKTLPGSKEEWRLKISGVKGEKLAAEMLAGMYDASLDQFAAENWRTPGIFPVYSSNNLWESRNNFGVQVFQVRDINFPQVSKFYKIYDRFIFGVPLFDVPYNHYNPYDGDDIVIQQLVRMPGMQMDTVPQVDPNDPSKIVRYVVTGPDSRSALAAPFRGNMYAALPNGESVLSRGNEKEGDSSPPANIQVRKNFNETAFFLPDLKTDSTGAIEFSFTMPEALTKWKFQALAHTKDLAFGYSSKEIVTQKEVMVQPNTPRFLREGDQLIFNAKVVNLSDKELSGVAELQLFNTATNQPVDILFNLKEKNKAFKIAAGQSAVLFFPLNIPVSYTDALTWKVVAKAGSFSDGEENVLPVLSNRLLVTETISLPARGQETNNFSFDKLKQSGNSSTLQHHSLTVEYTSNPAWYAVQALPYLMEYPYDCAEQTWSRYYANSLASSVANASPKLKQVFEQWKNTDTAALMSNLQKNQELKSILLEETPWVLDAKNETQQKQHIGLLFDMMRMSKELNNAYEKLKRLQSGNGGFVWFSGGPDDRYMTQYIITGIGHLKQLKALPPSQESKLNLILRSAIPYLDRKMKEDYEELIRYKTDLKKYTPGYDEIQYFYMRSFFPEYKLEASTQTAYNYFKSRLPVAWTKQNKYMQGMIALALHRFGDKTTPFVILKSLKETSINNEELGMYWKNINRGWWWYEAPIERQALLIEAFSEISKDTKTVNDLCTWLLKNKQTNKWESTKATADACYALLLQGTSWISEEPVVNIKLGNTTVNSTDNKQEAGTGYFSKTFQAKEVKPEMGNISVTVSGANTGAPSWGGVYWQYFEHLDKITTAATPLQLQKKLFVETNSDRGPVLTPVKDGEKLKIGDKIKVRIELRVDRDMEYVHMKDMRASSLEPVNVLSSYKWQDGIGYYESTKDAATNFFFDDLRKGTYVFEYTLFVTHAGNFSNGVTTIQCMYAPEFSAHSEGVRITVQ